ncbi:MAG: hypothetical protein HGA73_04720 [Syntrophaceae bacterium]|nr:hypothetical protein [Syntrophaceae bacterium]
MLSRVRRLLERMYREGRLYSMTCNDESDPDTDLDTLMLAIFPSPGYLDQAVFEHYIGPGERKMVYHSVREAYTKPDPSHRADLKTAVMAAAETASSVSNDKAGLEAVFGSEKLQAASSNYRKIYNRLYLDVSDDIENRITTDYNLDSRETFVGGWASFENKHIHLESTVVTDPLKPESKVTILHEASHLASKSILDDGGYYGSPGFEAATKETKIDNAAHYEELPRRRWGISRYNDKTFTPGISGSGKPLTTEEQIRVGGIEYYRCSWDAAADFDDLIKQARRDELNGTGLDAGTLARILEVSPLMDLTLHEQTVSPLNITKLDITTSESIVRAIGLAPIQIITLAKTKIMPTGRFRSKDKEIAAGINLAVDAAMAAYGGMLGDAKRDRKLIDWLHDHYQKVFV